MTKDELRPHMSEWKKLMGITQDAEIRRNNIEYLAQAHRNQDAFSLKMRELGIQMSVKPLPQEMLAEIDDEIERLVTAEFKILEMLHLESGVWIEGASPHPAKYINLRCGDDDPNDPEDYVVYPFGKPNASAVVRTWGKPTKRKKKAVKKYEG